MTLDSQTPYGIGIEAQYKRGVLFLDNMEYTTPYVVTGTGSDFAVAVAPGAKLFGEKGLEMKTRSTSPAEDDIVTAKIQICYPESDRLVTRLRIGIPDISQTKDVQVTLTILNGMREYLAGIKYDAEAKKLYFWSAGGAWVEFTGYGYTIYDTFWTILDIGIDLGKLEYLFCLFMGAETDMSGTAFQNVGVSAGRSIELSIVDTALTAAVSVVFIDSLYIGEYAEL